MAFAPNLGHLPPECIIYGDLPDDAPEDAMPPIVGYRMVRVMLFRDESLKQAREREPWPSRGGRPNSTNWTISEEPHDFEIRKWEIA